MYLRSDNVHKVDRLKQRAYMYSTHTGFVEKERGERGDICALSREALQERIRGGQIGAYTFKKYNEYIHAIAYKRGIFTSKYQNAFCVIRFSKVNHFLDTINQLLSKLMKNLFKTKRYYECCKSYLSIINWLLEGANRNQKSA